METSFLWNLRTNTEQGSERTCSNQKSSLQPPKVLKQVSLQERQLEKSEEAGAGAQSLNGIGRIPNQRNAKQRIPGHDAYNCGTLDSARVNRNHWWKSYASSVIVIKRHGKWIWRSKLSYFGQCHYLRVHRTRQIVALHRRAYFGVWSMSARDFSTPSFSHIFNYFRRFDETVIATWKQLLTSGFCP